MLEEEEEEERAERDDGWERQDGRQMRSIMRNEGEAEKGRQRTNGGRSLT